MFKRDKNILKMLQKTLKKSLNYFDPDDLLDIASSKSHLGSSLIEVATLTGKKKLFDKAT